MRDCVNVAVRDRLPDLLHERLGSDERAMLVAHVAECVDCAAELEVLRGVRGLVAVATPSVDVARVVRGVVPAATAARQATRRAPWGRRAGAIGSLALAAGLGAVMLLRDGGPTAAPSTLGPVPAVSATGIAPVSPDAPSLPAAIRPAPAAPEQRAPAPTRELALAETVADVADGELAALLTEIEALDAMPDADPEELLPTPTRERASPGGSR